MNITGFQTCSALLKSETERVNKSVESVAGSYVDCQLGGLAKENIMGCDDICCMVVCSAMLGLKYLNKIDKLGPRPFKSSKYISG